MNTPLCPAKSFSSFWRAFINLENRALQLSVQVDLIEVYSGETPEVESNEHRNHLMQLQFRPDETVKINKISEIGRVLTSPARGQLSAILLTLRESERSIIHHLSRCRELLRQGDVVSAVRGLIDLEEQRLQPTEKIAQLTVRTCEQRVRGMNAIRHAAADLVAGQLYETVERKLAEDMAVTQGVLPLPALLLPMDSSSSTSEWEHAQEKLARIGISVPVALQGYDEGNLPQIWNTIRFSLPICRQLSRELGLTQEVYSSPHFLNASSLTPQLRSMLTACGEEVVAEILATFTGGPAYVGSSIESLAYGADQVVSANQQTNFLPSYVRWELQCATLRELGFHAEAESYRAIVQGVYGPSEYALTAFGPQPHLTEFVQYVPQFVRNILVANFSCLKGGAVRQYFPDFGVEQYAQANQIADKLCSSTTNSADPSSFWNPTEITKGIGRATTVAKEEKNYSC